MTGFKQGFAKLLAARADAYDVAAARRFRSSRRAVAFGWLAMVLAAPFAVGLSPAQQRADRAAPPAFETLAIRRASGDAKVVVRDVPGSPQGDFRGLASLEALIRWAEYGPPGQEIVGGPPWLARYGFDVTMVLKQNEGYGPNAMRWMLEQRFGLRVHMEIDPVYVLDAPRTGTRLREVPRKPETVVELSETPGRIAFRGTGSEAITAAVGRALGQPLLDHTGLTGLYDAVLEWPLARPLSADSALDARSAQAAEAAVLATALREQLGLELVSLPREILVVDKAELPVDD